MIMDLEISPLRSLDDFILDSARFQIPNVKDMEKWGNRVVNNLLYYQTNYFLMSVVIFLLVGVLHPVKMLCGMMAIGVAFGLFYYFSNTKRAATRFKKEHPFISLLLIILGGYFIVYMLGSVVVFLFGILLPFGVTFVHASMRLRNMKNKLVNRMEVIGLKKTPMGVFLEELGSIVPFPWILTKKSPTRCTLEMTWVRQELKKWNDDHEADSTKQRLLH